MHPSIRSASSDDLPALAQLWYDGWQVAHADHVPKSLTEIRTLDSFKTRLSENLENIRIFAPLNTPLGLCIIKENEIYQIFVSPEAQGTGAATALITNGLDRIRNNGHTQAKLDVIPENARAIAFYKKRGWQAQSVETIMLDTLTEPYPLPCLVMTIDL